MKQILDLTLIHLGRAVLPRRPFIFGHHICGRAVLLHRLIILGRRILWPYQAMHDSVDNPSLATLVARGL